MKRARHRARHVLLLLTRHQRGIVSVQNGRGAERSAVVHARCVEIRRASQREGEPDGEDALADVEARVTVDKAVVRQTDRTLQMTEEGWTGGSAEPPRSAGRARALW